ncbi:AAA family ATPase [Aeromonas veronii]|uniref:ATP-dependent nuclease n=1 Tax=Aeromonas veronii TaxID=654 RepID=UPI00191D6E15|nr:AAA family ATPase [Aeromonas veronii]MBL0639143.1 AAA family ATPase [Aeromonas veronii]
MKIYALEVRHLKSFENFSVELSLEKGLYAITGTNGVGKSSLMSLLAKPFLPSVLDTYFLKSANENSEVIYKIDGCEEKHQYKNNAWISEKKGGDIKLRGFYEGSVIHGTRFSDANLTAIQHANSVSERDLADADEFVKSKLSYILHGYDGKYNTLRKIKHRDIAFKKFKFRGTPYFMEYESKLVSQFSMSTGESLLISLLHFINNTVIRNDDQKTHKLILIDEVELALHPSSLKRLIDLLKELSKDRNLTVYFSTHSIELVRTIKPDNVYYLQPGVFGDIEVVNPCYPAYATRSLYDHDGYDFLILVEDELAKYIIARIIDENELYHSKLIHILPCAGWKNTVRLHDDIVKSNLVGLGCAVMTVLDGDVQNDFRREYTENGLYNNINVQFLSVQSVEKYIFEKLVSKPDKVFAKRLGDKFYRVRALNDILADYKTNYTKDSGGKKLYALLKACARDQKTSESEFVTLLSEFIYDYEDFSKLSTSLNRIING